MTFTAPIAYQEADGLRRAVPVAYQLHGREYGFALGAYDPTRPLVIDPLLQSTFLGGSGTDDARALAIHPTTGDVYVAGSTDSTTFPGTTGGAQASSGGGFDAFVARFNSALTTLTQATFLGGSGTDDARALAIHPTTGDVYVAGRTGSTTFPGTTGGAQASTGGGFDAFVSRFTSALTTLTQSTFLGGSSLDEARALAIHPTTGDVYVAGDTDSATFPGTTGGALASFGGGFVARFNSALTTLTQSTFLGGSGTELLFALAIHPTTGDVYVAGRTTSTTFPAATGGAQASTGGGQDAFVARLSAGTPDLTITKTHTGDFTQGQTGATYTITVTNGGTAATSGTVTVTDLVPAGLTATAISGTGWSCTQPGGPCSRSDALAPGGSYPAITLTVTVAGAAPSSVTNMATVAGGGEVNTGNNTASDPTTIIVPPVPVADLTIAKTHSGSFTQGQTGATYTITVTNSGAGATSGTVTVTDLVPAGLTATAISGAGWSCTQPSGPCTRSDVLPAGGSYPAITLTVDVAGAAPSSVTNMATVGGGGEVDTTNNTATDPTTIIIPPPPVSDLTIAKTHAGAFTRGETGATYTITVTNSGAGATSGTVTVTDLVPAGLTATAISGPGWSCTQPAGPCTRSDVLPAGGSYPAITLTVTVADTAPLSVTNSATVAGGGETNTANNTANDPTAIVAPGTVVPIPVASPFGWAVMIALLLIAGLAAMRRRA